MYYVQYISILCIEVHYHENRELAKDIYCTTTYYQILILKRKVNKAMYALNNISAGITISILKQLSDRMSLLTS